MTKECLWTYNKDGQCYHTGCDGTHIDIHDYIGDYCTCCGGKIAYGNKAIIGRPMSIIDIMRAIYKPEDLVNAN